jgi:hypothetical protein
VKPREENQFEYRKSGGKKMRNAVDVRGREKEMSAGR